MRRWMALLMLLSAAPAFAGGVLTPAAGPIPQQSPLYNYKTKIQKQDECLSGTTSTGNVCELGWGVAGGTTAWIASETNRYGIVRRDSGAIASTLTRLDLSGSASSLIDPATLGYYHFEARLNTNDTDTLMRLGVMNASSSATPNNGLYLEKGLADTNWQCVTRGTSSQTKVDSGVAVDTNFNGFRVQRLAGGVQFWIGGAAVCGVMSTNLPTAFVVPAMQLTNNSGVSKTYDLDYFEMELAVTR